ncbi:3-oxoacyl-[acyl-carrier-protein] reductase [Desulfoluna spongiiphila]|uniref:3-oxoacyl-[acyl-carrier-protein] reductase n=1 Tax=Desulfoluna spongiiphila TaxID=419481 RepID=UPI001259B5C9|nr:3-oxoacyl-[acyl-carrier-protein] reductase [Desulfoluna spongiiphila]VVS92842.1 3-oxoacyl-(acyl-carrier-protein) reductase [Desulfoluna spongiiphila]
MPDTNPRSIVVTGGSRGIGRAVCLEFAGPDTRIFFNYASSEEAARQTESLVAEKGGTAVGIRVDVTSEAEVAAFIKKVVDDTGRMDVLVNNAGVTRDGLLVRMKESDWETVCDTNLKGAFFCLKAAARPMMKQRYGRIINITSMVGVTGNAGQANYCASKAGLIGLTRSAARELASRQITVNAVAPGFIDTDMTATLSEEAIGSIIDQIPMQRTGSPSEVAGVVAFLASERAAYITGQVLHVNGGMFTS